MNAVELTLEKNLKAVKIVLINDLEVTLTFDAPLSRRNHEKRIKRLLEKGLVKKLVKIFV